MTQSPSSLLLSRRRMLTLGGSFAAWSMLPVLPSFAATRDPRFLLVILRGGLDGLAAAMPVGDPQFAGLRGAFVEDAEKRGPLLPLTPMFALNPALQTLAALYAKREAIVVHAVATPYRERSHFDGQEILESGLPTAAHGDIGWLNRALGGLEGRGQIAPGHTRGLSVGPTLPLVMRGPAPVLSWSPRRLPKASEDTVGRLLSLYDARDPMLADALRRGVETAEQAAGAGMDNKAPMAGAAAPRNAGPILAMAEGAAQLMSKPDGPRVAALSLDGWDTHADQKPGTGRLGRMLDVLDQVIERLSTGMAPVWKDTVVTVVTEFGRTVRINGTSGTDHGTATLALLLGGAVRGGQVVADWPGLAEPQLHERRDLKPTLDLRSVFAAVLTDHLGIDARTTTGTVFPGTGNLPPVKNLIV